MPTFGAAERNILDILSVGAKFSKDNVNYTILKCGKPKSMGRGSGGEPKTDAYILALGDDNNRREFKISFKKINADFIENKMGAERASYLYGDTWQDCIRKATESIAQAFEARHLIYKKKSGRTDAGAITLGWKFELVDKSNGELSSNACLSYEQAVEAYAGYCLPKSKKNAFVDGEQIKDSGIANYILHERYLLNLELTPQTIIDNLFTPEQYVRNHPTVYFACKALNYRTYKNKYDGDRPLSVYVDWSVSEGKLKSTLVYDNPLNVKGTEVANKLKSALTELNISTTCDITNDLVVSPSIILG